MNRARTYTAAFFPILFSIYVGCLIAFTHVHIIDGVTIVHSHPYKTSQGQPVEHEHSYAVFQLLDQLSVIQSVDTDFGISLFIYLPVGEFITTSSLVYPDYLSPIAGKLFLRPPPVC